jgi:hypothetical protein
MSGSPGGWPGAALTTEDGELRNARCSKTRKLAVDLFRLVLRVPCYVNGEHLTGSDLALTFVEPQ